MMLPQTGTGIRILGQPVASHAPDLGSARTIASLVKQGYRVFRR